MSNKHVKLSEQIRRAVDACGMSRYSICMATKIDQASFSRFMTGAVGLTMANLDALADVLRLDIAAGKPIKLPPPQKPGRKPKTKAR